MAQRIIPVIMSGGAGTRLWPLSTAARPKQFHAIGAGRSLIQETCLRLQGAAGEATFSDPIVIAGAGQRDLVIAQLAEIGVTPELLVLEPVGRDTAATAAIAAAAARAVDPDALVLLAPADHLVADAAGFRAAIGSSVAAARELIVTFGIIPARPETGFGYIQSAGPFDDHVRRIARFHEKPNREAAEGYLREGGFFWNAGIFLFAPDVLLAEFAPAADIRDKALEAFAGAEREGRVALLPARFAETPAKPIDIAVMERTARGGVCPCDVGWADVGSWSEVWRLSAQDAAGNALIGPALVEEGQGNLVMTDGRVVALHGVSDLVVIATAEAVLVIPKSEAQAVKALAKAATALASPKPAD